MNASRDLPRLLTEVRACRHCEGLLPFAPRPVLRAAASARLLIIGQAPGTKVHASGIPWDDASGARLRDWMGVDSDCFYDTERIAIIPMGLCYPGRGRGGDLPPRPECARLWHARLLALLPNLRLTLLIGDHAQRYYLPERRHSLTWRVRHWRDWLPHYFALVHPSPRNTLWLRRNPWFEEEVVPALREQVRRVLHEPASAIAPAARKT